MQVAVPKQCGRSRSCPATQSTSCKLPRSLLQVLKQALLRESSSIAEPNGFSSASKPCASQQALTRHVASLSARLSWRALGVSCWKGLSDSSEQNSGCSDRASAQFCAARGCVEAAVGVESQGIPISCTAAAVDGRLPHSRAIFLSFFPSTVCHICQSNDDRLRLTPILRLINTLLLSGSVTDGTSALVLFHVVFVSAAHYLSRVHSLPVSSHLGRTDSSPQHLCELGEDRTGASFMPAALGLSQDGRGSPPACCPERDAPTPP